MNPRAVSAAALVLCESQRRDHLLGKRRQPCPTCTRTTEEQLAAYTDALSEEEATVA